MKQKSAKTTSYQKRKNLNWRKILLIVVGSITGIIALIILGFFLWMQTWKTYEFPDGQGSIKYPPFWVLEPRKLNSDGMGLFGEITDGSNIIGIGLQISLVRYYPAWNRTAQQDAQQRANQVVSYYGGQFVNLGFAIEGEPIYSAQESFSKDIEDQYIEFTHKGYVYEFQFRSNYKGLRDKLEKELLSLMLQSIRFNPTAVATTQKSSDLSN
ncbi:hypothetical protein C5B42_00540 [Candidatus Cerribacteria bacterium 'Amazon FNV 2010 28 9']|uniref:Uncharacterized protein n=1 Tax=Candidatus Cerribacteria bacterium 'Amazon FNV 2010 28 9' TaxID=2081795 RepID=A0A317JQH7_9BACT|nr:MAG: hypothetical protein C5B42_00540 [Candidatus Cerribacteria bacterium 'Amazon FNV 2010 28 9']